MTAEPVIDLSGLELKMNFQHTTASTLFSGPTRDLTHFMDETSNFSDPDPDFDRDYDALSLGHRNMILGDPETDDEELLNMPELPRLQRQWAVVYKTFNVDYALG